jgi:hypothetical protein
MALILNHLTGPVERVRSDTHASEVIPISKCDRRMDCKRDTAPLHAAPRRIAAHGAWRLKRVCKSITSRAARVTQWRHDVAEGLNVVVAPIQETHLTSLAPQALYTTAPAPNSAAVARTSMK